MDGEPELPRKRMAVWAVESNLINGRGNGLSRRASSMSSSGQGPLLTRDGFRTFSPRIIRSNARHDLSESCESRIVPSSQRIVSAESWAQVVVVDQRGIFSRGARLPTRAGSDSVPQYGLQTVNHLCVLPPKMISR